MHKESSTDPEKLQRLIDGELSVEEVRKLLQGVDDNSGQWRNIACAFVEDQLFRQQFETLTDDAIPKAVKPLKSATSKDEVHGNSSATLVRQLAIAASLAVAGLVGYLVGTDNSTFLPDESGTSNMIANDHQSAADPSLTPVNLEPEYRMELLTPDGEAIDGEVDLYRYDDLHRLVGNTGSKRRVTLKDVLPESGFSPEVRQRLSRSGYDINESTNYMSGRLQDGRQFVVPVRSIRFDQGH